MTPFSPRALDRGLVAVVTALVRHLHPEMTPASSAVKLADQRGAVEHVVAQLVERTRLHDETLSASATAALGDEVERLTRAVLDAWATQAAEQAEVGAKLQYAHNEIPGGGKSLLRDPVAEPKSPFRAARSLREVEAETGFWVRTPDGLEEGDAEGGERT